MAPLARWGRILFFIIASLMLYDQVTTLVSSLTGDPQRRNWLNSIVMPFVISGFFYSVWRGDKSMRWAIGFWYLFKGFHLIVATAIIGYKMAVRTPPEQAAFFLQIFMTLFGVLLAFAFLYITSGAALIWSPTVKAYLNYRWKAADRPPPGMPRWFLDRVEPDGYLDFFKEIRQRTRHPVLTKKIFDSLDDSELSGAVADHMELKMTGDRENQFKIVAAMPRCFQATYCYYVLHFEVYNGGLHQYFFNHGVEWAFMALEGLKFLGANELAKLLTQAIEIHLAEEKEQASHSTENPDEVVDEYVTARKLSKLPELDDEFYRLDDPDIANRYIRAHVGEFITR